MSWKFSTVELIKQDHNRKIGDQCEFILPNVTENTLFTVEGEIIGFYLTELPDRARQFAEIANAEFLSNNVPKMTTTRSPSAGSAKQYSTIIGSVPAKPHMRRNYPQKSSVHAKKSAQTFVKAMLKLCAECEVILGEIMPDQYNKQLKIFESVPDKWKFGKIFTSSISNFNIPAPFHRDGANFENTVNFIITKRKNSVGGCLHVPDYGATIEQADNSLLVYPAWLNVHGVTPIQATQPGGYRNSLVFYPLKAFKGLE